MEEKAFISADMEAIAADRMGDVVIPVEELMAVVVMVVIVAVMVDIVVDHMDVAEFMPVIENIKRLFVLN